MYFSLDSFYIDPMTGMPLSGSALANGVAGGLGKAEIADAVHHHMGHRALADFGLAARLEVYIER